MAPRGPSKPNDKSNKGRKPNETQPSKKGPGSRPKSEGGISKKRGPANRSTRIDDDGDLSMAVGPGSNSKPNQNNDNRHDRKGPKHRGGWALVRVNGLKESKVAEEKNGGVDKLLRWIEKKSGERSKGKVSIIKVCRKRAVVPSETLARSFPMRSLGRACNVGMYTVCIFNSIQLGSSYDGSVSCGFMKSHGAEALT